MMNMKYLDPFQSGRSRAQITVVLLAIGMAVDLIAIVSSLFQASLLSNAAAGLGITDADATANDNRQQLIGIIQLLVLFATAVCFLMWFHRAHKNLPALGAGNLEYSPGWAVGGFFVPFLNLVRPFQVMREIWKASDPEVDLSVPHSWLYVATSPIIGFWWAAWLIAGFLGQIAFRLSINNTSIDEMVMLTYLTIASDAVSIIAAAFAIVLVRSIDERQEQKFRRLVAFYTPPPQQPPPPNDFAWGQRA
jgi:hypothetical protein